MDYIVRVPKISGDIVPLVLVADAMATAKATAFGASAFHWPAYYGARGAIAASLHKEAKKGALQVCNQDGFEASADELIDDAKRAGTFCVARQYLIEPDWDALKAKHPERNPPPGGVWDWTGIDLGKSEVDMVSSELHCLYATLKHLNDWGASAGNSFSLDPNAPPWIDERGLMGLPENQIDDGIEQEVGAGATSTSAQYDKQLPWWQTDYDILLLARNAGDSLRRKNERTSNRKIGDAVANRIEAEEQRGKKRKPPSGEHIKNTVLKGWEYQPDQAE